MLGCEEIKTIFEGEFYRSHNIVLLGGAEEPVYLPAENHLPSRLYYTRDYPASALHEIAHWCLAHTDQLLLKDWGLWYVPDGRNAMQQQTFQRVEARVQAIEWILSVAAGRAFRESSDNLSSEKTEDALFKDNIYTAVLEYCLSGLPERAAILFAALSRKRGSTMALKPDLFTRTALL